MDYNLKNELDKILMSNNVTENFNNKYVNDELFKTNLLDLLPEIRDCEMQQQRTPWHNRTVLSHILNVVDNINKLSTNYEFNDKKLLSYVAFYHDLGKPASHITRVVEGEERDSFPGHQNESCKIADRTLSYFGFDDKQLKEAEFLIQHHDFIIGIMRNSEADNLQEIVEDLVNELESKFDNGIELMQMLLNLAMADNLAQNSDLAKKPIKILEEMQYILNLIKNKKKGNMNMDDKQYYSYKTTINRFMKREGISYQAVVLSLLKKYSELEQKLQNLNSSTEFDILNSEYADFIQECKNIERDFNFRFSELFRVCVDDKNLLFDMHNQFGEDLLLFETLMNIKIDEFNKFIEEANKNKSHINRKQFSLLTGNNFDLDKCIDKASERTYS